MPMHTSIKLDTPVEFINITPLNPLISKCQIKVCYVGDEPNRNRSVITKEVAKQMANSLPGCPIVGFYNEEKGDFEEHQMVSLKLRIPLDHMVSLIWELRSGSKSFWMME